MLTAFEITTIVFAFAYLVQAWYIGKLLRLKTEMAKEHTHLLLSSAEGKLAEALLEQNKVSLQTQKDMLEAVTIFSERISSYNKRLNNLTTTVGFKIDKTSFRT